jgi:hypothetical protein
MWTPGYWAYGSDGYYWVPGAWVPAPYVGALWTPPYWGWSGGLYVWHPGYWGSHVGYYGGVNYGFGYMGVGFAGGMWRGGVFAYNGAVMRVGAGGAWGGNRVYVDRTVVERTTIINNNHISYNGGPGGIRHDPGPEERIAEHDQHMERSSFQTQHENSAMHDRSAYVSHNGGHPANLAVARPLGSDSHGAPMHTNGNANFNASHGNGNAGFNGGSHEGGNANFNAAHGNNGNANFNASHGNNGNANFNASHGNTNYREPQSQSHAQPEYHAAPQQRSAPQERSAPRPENHGHDEGHGHGR